MASPRIRHPLLDDRDELALAYGTGVSISDLADQAGVSPATVRRALIRHGIDRLPRNRNRRPPTAARLDDRTWLAKRYRASTAVEIAHELGVSPRTVYAAMDRHGIARRPTSATLKLQHPELDDERWLRTVATQRSSTDVAGMLGVSTGTVTAAYRGAGITPSSTTRFYARGRLHRRPSPSTMRAAWDTERTLRGVGARIGVTHATAAVWLAEIGIFLCGEPAIRASDLKSAIDAGHTLSQIATEYGVGVTTVRVELHRHGLFDTHGTRHLQGSSA